MPLFVVDSRGMIVDNRGMIVKAMPKPSDLLQGTLDLLILKTLEREPRHGWGISKRIQELSDEELSVGQGSLYPALHRLEHQGWIVAKWKDSEFGRSAKFYSLTRDGRQQLARELDNWKRLSSAVGLLIKRA
jgi:PadR family transcriptional regulator PadR